MVETNLILNDRTEQHERDGENEGEGGSEAAKLTLTSCCAQSVVAASGSFESDTVDVFGVKFSADKPRIQTGELGLCSNTIGSQSCIRKQHKQNHSTAVLLVRHHHHHNY